MHIKTKYDLKDRVYFLRNNIVTSGVISCVKTSSTKVALVTTHYHLQKDGSDGNWLDFSDLREEDLFASKEELLKSL